MRAFFAPGGLLARTHPHYEFRSGQLEMAELVAEAFRERRPLLVEAGTGTGKTLAYLVPALLSGRRVVVSTGTKNLQEQLYQKDIPFLEQHLGRPLRVCYMKGRNNYLCRQKLYEMTAQAALPVDLAEAFAAGVAGNPPRRRDHPPDFVELAIVRQWETRTEIGDRAELEALPESSALWRRLDARRETCTGQKCEQFERCFLTLMRQRALESDLIIVNHHLFFADLALKAAAGPDVPILGVIPDYSAVVFDEAHELEDVAAQYFGLSASSYQVEDLARDCEFTSRARGVAAPEVSRAAAAARERCGELFARLSAAAVNPKGPATAAAANPDEDGRFGFDNRDEFLERHQAAYAGALGALEGLEAALAALREKPEEVHNLVRRAAELRRDLRVLVESSQRAYVHWIERRGRGIFLQATPIDVAPILSEALFDRLDTCVLTSATLSVAGSFDFVKRRLGARYARERILDSHFDFRSQALLYLPAELPDPRSSQFSARAAGEVCGILEATRGRAFVLFTSYHQMHRVYELAAPRLKFPLLVQGSAPRTALLDRFRKLPGAVLFATSSFWQGVDVPGAQLSCVIIDRLPFAVPGDPVVAARLRVLREDGGDPFLEYQVPQAVIALKQGFGRLIRSRTDRGVLAILDPRILTRNYGTIFLESLPDYPSTRDLGEVERFMNQEQRQNVRSHR